MGIRFKNRGGLSAHGSIGADASANARQAEFHCLLDVHDLIPDNGMNRKTTLVCYHDPCAARAEFPTLQSVHGGDALLECGVTGRFVSGQSYPLGGQVIDHGKDVAECSGIAHNTRGTVWSDIHAG